MSHDVRRAETHISSILVHLRPDCRAETGARIAALPGAEIHGESADGKLVVVLETPNEAEILVRIDAINGMTGVVATSLIYHEIDSADADGGLTTC